MTDPHTTSDDTPSQAGGNGSQAGGNGSRPQTDPQANVRLQQDMVKQVELIENEEYGQDLTPHWRGDSVPTSRRLQPKLLICDDEGQITEVTLQREEVFIGRKKGNAIRLTQRNVSRQHARLYKENEAFYVEDLESYGGVFLNGKRINAPVLLATGDELGIGDYKLRVELGDTLEDKTLQRISSAPLSDAPTVSSLPRLIMLGSPRPGRQFELQEGENTLGRAEESSLWINHRSISRDHALLRVQGKEILLFDLRSVNGSRVNGNDVKTMKLEHMDLVELGEVPFRYVAPAELYEVKPDLDRFHQSKVQAMQSSNTPLRSLLWLAGITLVVTGIWLVLTAR